MLFGKHFRGCHNGSLKTVFDGRIHKCSRNSGFTRPDITLQQALQLADRVANAAAFPIAREIPEAIKTKVDEYLFKDKKEQK